MCLFFILARSVKTLLERKRLPSRKPPHLLGQFLSSPAWLLLSVRQRSLKWHIQTIHFSSLASTSASGHRHRPFFFFSFSTSWLRFTQRFTCRNKDGAIWLLVSISPAGENMVFFYIAEEDWATGNELMCIIYNFERFSLAVWFLFRRREGKKKPVAPRLSPDLGLEGVQILVIKLELWISGGLSCWFSLVFPSRGCIANCYWQHGTCELVGTPQCIAQYHLSRKQYAH